jgi:hypothetical protein
MTRATAPLEVCDVFFRLNGYSELHAGFSQV